MITSGSDSSRGCLTEPSMIALNPLCTMSVTLGKGILSADLAALDYEIYEPQ
jgi:hypothetical protein